MLATAREHYVTENFGLVHHCILNHFKLPRSFSKNGIGYEDVYQEGCLALMYCAENFKEELGLKFSTYAVPQIIGRIRRLFRDNGHLLHISRQLTEKIHEAKRIKNANPEITAAQVAERLGISLQDYLAITEENLVSLNSDAFKDENKSKVSDVIGRVCSGYSGVENRMMLQEAMSMLLTRVPKQHYQLFLRYLQAVNTDGNISQVDLGNEFGVSQVQVSRVLARCKSILSDYIKE